MNGSTRNGSPFLVVVALLEIILVLLPLGAQGFAQSEEAQRAWLRSLDSLSSERMLADVTTLSSPAFNGRQTGTTDDASSAKWVADRFQDFRPLIGGRSPRSNQSYGSQAPECANRIDDHSGHGAEHCTRPRCSAFQQPVTRSSSSSGQTTSPSLIRPPLKFAGRLCLSVTES